MKHLKGVYSFMGREWQCKGHVFFIKSALQAPARWNLCPFYQGASVHPGSAPTPVSSTAGAQGPVLPLLGQPAAGQDGAEAPGVLGFHQLHNPGCLLSDPGPQLTADLLSPAAGEPCANTPAHGRGDIRGTRLPHPTAPAQAAAAVPGKQRCLHAGMQDTGRAGHAAPCHRARLPTLRNGGTGANAPGAPGWRCRCRRSQSRGAQGRYLNLSIPTGDGEESLTCSRCLGLLCSEI